MTETSSTTVELPANTVPTVKDPYALQANDVLNALRGHRNGLSDTEAADRLKTVGPNQLQPRRKKGR